MKKGKPAQRATAFDREIVWELRHASHASLLIQRYAVARYAGLPFGALRTHGSRTRRGLYAVARYAGLPVVAGQCGSGPLPLG